MIRTDRRIRLCKALIVCNLCFIWGNSLLPGEISGAFSDWVNGVLASIYPSVDTALGSGGFLRKAAHFTEFAVLGALLSWLLGMLGKDTRRALAWGCFAACVDETIQRFVPDRGPSIRDVGIDTCGVLFGMLLLIAGHTLLKRRNQSSMEE